MNNSSEQNDGNVFDRPLYVAGVLDNTADDLQRTWLGYDWNDRTRCNCGFVARQVLNVSAQRLRKLLPPIHDNGAFRPTWGAMSETYCTDTGLSHHEVFARLLAAGLRVSDFGHLEQLSHPSILQRVKASRPEGKPVSRSRKADVIAYLRHWAVGIEEHHEQAVRARGTSRLSV